MDWTAVFAETGEEELLVPASVAAEMAAPRLSRLVSAMYHHGHHGHHGSHRDRRTPSPPRRPRFASPSRGERRRRRSRGSAGDEMSDGGGSGGDGDGDGEGEGYESHRFFAFLEEDAFEDDDGEAKSTSSAASSTSYYDSASYTLSALYCLTINYILGVGCLGVPYAFARAGFVLCGVIILTVTVTSYITVMWVAECGAEAEAEVEAAVSAAANAAAVVEEDAADASDTNGTGTTPDAAVVEVPAAAPQCSSTEPPRPRAPVNAAAVADDNDDGHGIDGHSEKEEEEDDDDDARHRLQEHLEIVTPPKSSPSEKTSLLRHRRRREDDASAPSAAVEVESTSSSFDPRRYEVIDLVSYYLGPIHKSLYQLSLMALMYIGLLAYSQVFCGAVSALLPSSQRAAEAPERDTTAWYLRILPQVVFGSVVVPLSCTELDEQVAVQAVMACVRFVAILIMVGGSVMALFLDDRRAAVSYDDDGGYSSSSSSSSSGPPYFAAPDEENCRMSYTACFSGFGVAFSTALFSQLFQHSVPGLIRPLDGQREKVEKVPLVFGASLLTTWSFYMLLGITAASYFGADTRSSVNLNFADDFTFGLDPSATAQWILTVCKLASSVVVMFPALDTLSVFPLIANTLGNNLLATSSPAFPQWVVKRMMHSRQKLGMIDGSPSSCDGWFHSVIARLLRQLRGGAPPNQQQQPPPDSSSVNDAVDEKKKLHRDALRLSTIFWRLVAAFPPLIGSVWATDLSFSLLLAGVAGLYVAFFAPSFMQLASCRRRRRRRQRRSLSPPAAAAAAADAEEDASCLMTTRSNVFEGWYSNASLAYPVLGFATFSLGIVLVQIGDAWTEMMIG
eukprot:CAMPEP_0113589674 /NCGR_PEP_ID=MMETSP0015_2-20120614/36220_1 /TAXON_ID=2838 /ORGANISM="Odontella" /LENGTH=845 /DNA_ID=CAMNT_0000495721 /DNA_START=23 /DNA_END=2560 /DNA_ORIENTATION=+ /assembly_acc=CAM_ASM_000160